MDKKTRTAIERLLISRNNILLTEDIKGYFAGKTVLITGAGGSIGCEIAHKLLQSSCKKLILCDNSEYSLFNAEFELGDAANVSYIYKDIRDYAAFRTLFENEKIDIVLHCAALKHLLIVERNKEEAVKTNIVGCYNLMRLAEDFEIEKFIFISTDKAVDPSSFMGLTKLAGERLSAFFASKSKTSFVVVRFGNVIGSSGSVIPIFQKQIDKNMPLTVRSEEASRYFMSIHEAVFLVLKASVIGKTGDTYILKMGEPIYIYDIAKVMLKLNGKENLGINITGLKDGERTKEELMSSTEKSIASESDDFYFFSSCSKAYDRELANIIHNDDFNTVTYKKILDLLQRFEREA